MTKREMLKKSLYHEARHLISFPTLHTVRGGKSGIFRESKHSSINEQTHGRKLAYNYMHHYSLM